MLKIYCHGQGFTNEQAMDAFCGASAYGAAHVAAREGKEKTLQLLFELDWMRAHMIMWARCFFWALKVVGVLWSPKKGTNKRQT